MAAQYDLDKHWNIGAEINGGYGYGPAPHAVVIANVGVIYIVDEHIDIQFTAGRALQDNADAPDLLLQCFVQFVF